MKLTKSVFTGKRPHALLCFVRLPDPETDLAPVYELNIKSAFGSADPDSVAVLTKLKGAIHFFSAHTACYMNER